MIRSTVLLVALLLPTICLADDSESNSNTLASNALPIGLTAGFFLAVIGVFLWCYHGPGARRRQARHDAAANDRSEIELPRYPHPFTLHHEATAPPAYPQHRLYHTGTHDTVTAPPEYSGPYDHSNHLPRRPSPPPHAHLHHPAIRGVHELPAHSLGHRTHRQRNRSSSRARRTLLPSSSSELDSEEEGKDDFVMSSDEEVEAARRSRERDSRGRGGLGKGRTW